MVQILKKSDGTEIPGMLVAQGGSQYIFQFAKDGHTCEELQAAMADSVDPLVISTDGTDGTPIIGFGKCAGVAIVPATESGNLEDRIYVTMRQPTYLEKLQMAVEAGTITAEQYKQITGEAYEEASA